MALGEVGRRCRISALLFCSCRSRASKPICELWLSGCFQKEILAAASADGQGVQAWLGVGVGCGLWAVSDGERV